MSIVARWWQERRAGRHTEQARHLRKQAQTHDADVAASRVRLTRVETHLGGAHADRSGDVRH